jgi:hypothetical protein
MKRNDPRTRRPKRDPADAIVGLVGGAMLGIGLGGGGMLAIGLGMLPFDWFGWTTLAVIGAIAAIGMIAGAVLGYLKGAEFFRWVRDQFD